MILKRQKFDIGERCVIERLTIQAPFKYKAIFPDEACFLYFRSGYLRLTSANGASEIAARESVLLKCGNYFAEFAQSGDKSIVEVVAIHLYPDLLKKIYKNEIPPVYKSVEIKSFPKRIDNADVIDHYIENLNFYFDNPHIVTSDLLVLKIKELILLLLQTTNAASISDLIAQLFSPRQISLRDVVQAHLFSDLTISQLATLSGLSLSSFKRAFQKTYNDSPANYIKNRQLDEAVRLLRHSDFSIGEICYMIGFSDPSNFTKAFKKRMGCSPGQFKKKMENSNPLNLNDQSLNRSAKF